MATHLSESDRDLVTLGFLVLVLRWMQQLGEFFMESEALVRLRVNNLNAL